MNDTTPSMPWRLGLDLGGGSIGWAVYRVEPKPGSNGFYKPTSLIDGGVTVWPSGNDRDHQSAAVERRLYRSQRTHTRNTRKRKMIVLKRLIELRLLPKSGAERRRERDTLRVIGGFTTAIPAVWAWRWRGVNGDLEPHELGHVFMALCAARGQAFSDDTETSQRLAQADEVERRVAAAGCSTFGEYAAVQLASRPGAIVRSPKGTANYCSRNMVRAEFDAICTRQVAVISPDLHLELRALIFDQDLTAVLDPGKCPLVPTDHRLPRAHPLSQELKILQTLRNVRVQAKRGNPMERSERLSADEEAQAIAYLHDKKRVRPATLFKAIGLKAYSSNYHASEKGGDKENEIVGDETGATLSHPRTFGPAWFSLPMDRRTSIVEQILSYRDNDPQTGHRRRPDYAALAHEWGFSEAATRSAFDGLPRGRSAYGITASRSLLERLRAEPGEDLHTARERLFPQSSAAIAARDKLPYYGVLLKGDVFDADPIDAKRPAETATAYEERRYGRVRNPQVHVVLQQVRGLVNALIAEYGRPTEAIIELARDLSEGVERKRTMDRRMKERRDRRDRAAQTIRDIGVTPTRDTIDRYMLWEELGPEGTPRVDIYSGRRIENCAQLYNGEIEVDHIIPRSLCGDDSLSNKIVTFRAANQAKAERMPFQAFSGAEYEAVKERAHATYGTQFDKSLQRKYRRFLESAKEEFVEGVDFVGRELAATSYAAKLVRRYLTGVIPEPQVHVAHGRLTGRLRKAWELTKLLPEHAEGKAAVDALQDARRKQGKDLSPELKRLDHRHHLIDAAVVGMIDPTTIRFFFDMSETNNGKPRRLDFSHRAELKEIVDRTIVRHRPQHKRGYAYNGQIVKATRYRVRYDPVAGKRLKSSRKTIANLGFANDQWQLGTADTFSTNALEAIEKTGSFSDAHIQSARRIFSQDRYETLLSDLARRDGTGESARTSDMHRRSAWARLCSEFVAELGGQKTFREWETGESVFSTAEGVGMESGGNAYADVFARTTPKGKRSFRLAPVSLRDAARGPITPASLPGETLVCRVHPGDMLRLRVADRTYFVVVRALSESGAIRITLHHNAARADGRAVSYDTSIEGPTKSKGDRRVNWIFGEAKARIARIGPLGRPS